MGVKLNIAKYFEFLYNKVFVNIVSTRTTSTVYMEMINSKGVVISSVDKHFKTLELDSKMKDFIEQYTQETPFYYISTIDSSPLQWATSEVKNVNKDKNSLVRCYENSWSYNIANNSMEEIIERYKDIGLDFLFSPFSLLAYFFKEKIDGDLAMYVLVTEDYLTLTIFENSKLLYSKQIETESNNKDYELHHLELDLSTDEDEEDGFADIEDIVDIDEETEESIDLDDFGDIEDLDALEDIEEFSDDKVEEKVKSDEKISDFDTDYRRFTLLQESINNYYQDSKYKSDFIETIYIADSVGVSGDLKKYFEEELFLDVYVRQLDLAYEICDMAKMELK